MSNLQRDVNVPDHIIKFLTVLGIDVPDNMKEIRTPTEYSDETQKIILPAGMGKLTAAKELEAQWQNEESVNNFQSTFDGWNWQDVLVAVRRVTEREFGWMNGKDNFWSGAPTEIDILVD